MKKIVFLTLVLCSCSIIQRDAWMTYDNLGSKKSPVMFLTVVNACNPVEWKEFPCLPFVSPNISVALVEFPTLLSIDDIKSILEAQYLRPANANELYSFWQQYTYKCRGIDIVALGQIANLSGGKIRFFTIHKGELKILTGIENMKFKKNTRFLVVKAQ